MTDRKPLWLSLFFVCLALHLWLVSIGFRHTIVDQHGFRQTQTAITAFFMQRGGPFLRYETPVVGAPWSVPFEFPIYQWLVARAASFMPLDQAGRLLSELMFLFTLAALYAALAALRLPQPMRFCFLSLVLVSPLYIFWSRTFMIESTALFFSVAFLAGVLWGGPLALAGAMVAGSLAGLVKPTTFASFLLLAALVLAWRRSRAIALLALPVLLTFAWTRFVDAVKEQNVVGAVLTSRAVRTWIFGTFPSRFLFGTWAVQLNRAIPESIGHVALLALAAAAVLAMRRHRIAFFGCLLGYLSGPLVFTNIHAVHNYYAYANGIFLCAAIGFAIAALHERWPALALLLFGATAAASLAVYFDRYYRLQKWDRTGLVPLAAAVDAATGPDEVMLGFGLDWSPELPYAARRRALLWPDHLVGDIRGPRFAQAIANLRGARIGAAVLCGPALTRPGWIDRAKELLGPGAQKSYQDDYCIILAAR